MLLKMFTGPVPYISDFEVKKLFYFLKSQAHSHPQQEGEVSDHNPCCDCESHDRLGEEERQRKRHQWFTRKAYQ